jgi:predicted transcriptional regulator
MDNSTNTALSSGIVDSTKDTLRNPLGIFGLVLLAGDGPLVAAYALTQDPLRAWVLLVAIILFIFGMGGFFCYLVRFKPRHLYAPHEIPENAFGRNIYRDPEPVRKMISEAQSLARSATNTQNDSERKSLAKNLADKLQAVDQLQAAYDLLLIPGYDLSLISDILEYCERNESLDPNAIAYVRNITPSTVATITQSMISRGILKNKEEGDGLTLTEQGEDLLNRLRKHLRPLTSD